MEIVNKPLVMASEIAGLEPLNGYIKQENYVVRVRFPYVAPIERQPRFIERNVSVAVQQASVNFLHANTAPMIHRRGRSISSRYSLGAHDKRP